MTVVYAREPFPNSLSKSIFLAGPTPRSSEVESWRPKALEILRELGYDGTVFVPEDSSGSPKFDYLHQIDWEEKGLRTADRIVFWIPREIEKMPGFTTNVEWGAWQKSGKCVLGSPKNAPNMRYLQFYANRLHIPQATTLEDTLKITVELIGSGALREGGERDVPLDVWTRPAFQNWYRTQLEAGNRLDGARIEWQFAHSGRPAFCQVIRPKVYIPTEDRHKTGEIIISRPDTASVLAYLPGPTPLETQVVLVREFRSNAATSDGFVHELPGGSSPNPESNSLSTVSDELAEETGIRLPAERFFDCGKRQCLATTLTHTGNLFAVELTSEEFAQFRHNCGKRFGVNDSERTYVEIRTVKSILESTDVDWTHLGMIMSVLAAKN